MLCSYTIAVNMNRKKNLKQPTLKTSLLLTPEYKENVRSAGYLGRKGYTIPKSVMTEEDIACLKEELLVKPVEMKMSYGAPGAAQANAFPVYKENDKKMYLPRFYGIERYGLPDKSELQEGDDIDVSFDKPLRDYQEHIIGLYMNHIGEPIAKNHTQNGNGGILEVPCGRGKTVMALKIISNVQKKTLIIVHKEFLMNQWIERIQEFLPGARVGKIQGQKFDIEDKDIVIGMLQSLYDKDYGANGFQSFGLTIVDEVHRIGSEQFSKTLLKVTTPNMLGISATVDRKDGLTKVLYMFIGNKIYSEERKDEDPVCVRAIHFHSNDDEFNEVETDYRGNTKYSTMITKLCAHNPRTMFIIKILQDLLSEDPDKQIMVLCHNRSLLTAIYQYIKSWNDDEEMIGYYVGGMKQVDLEKTEKKRIVLATYAMAAEALDIKTLSTLVMVTPKTDITQSVGRILRVKHDKPIIVDLVDQHDPFQKQWIQRRRYYKKCNYKIIQNNSKKYTNMDTVDNSDEWKLVFDPKDKTTKMDEEKEAKSERKCLIAFDNLE
jgi:superfamily II DNA or RNA helicase